MPDYKELAIYGVLAVIIIFIVAYVLSGTLLGGNYNIIVKLAQVAPQNSTYPYETSKYLINVTNAGHSPISNLLIGFYIDGQTQGTNSVSIPAGQSIIFIRNYTYQAAGTYIFEAVADPGHILNMQNRQSAQNSITSNVFVPSEPNVYTSIPNANITSTQSFTLTSAGLISTSALGQRYNVNLINEFFGPAETISLKVFQSAYPYTANVYGAYAKYSDNSIAYTAWLQGTVNPQLLNLIISSFGSRTLQAGPLPIYYTPLNHTTSICTLYSGGWTKIVSYYNSSNPNTCLTLATSTYSAQESNVLINAIKNNRNLTHYQSEFFYTNVSILGSALTYSANNTTATNIFANNFGLFLGSIKKLAKTANTLANATCYGVVYNNNNMHMCTYLIPTRTGNYSLPYGLTNSSYLNTNYTVNLYSLVNNTELVAAHANAAKLINALAFTGNSVQWASPYKNKCVFANQSIGCTYTNFISSNNTAYFNITNKLPSKLTINKINCELSPGFPNVTVGRTIAPNASIAMVVRCNVVGGVAAASGQTQYVLILNYTYNNATKVISGILNVSNNQIH